MEWLKLWLTFYFLFASPFLLCLSYADPGIVTLEDVIVTATRTERDFSLPSTVHSLSSEELQNEKMVRTVPEALKEIPGIMVQRTSHGQGSPFIRGFTGFRTLFLIDGIRLNNSTFREGPNQYWSTVDPLTIERLEVVKGPSSVLYGSDAVGGTVNAITRGPYGSAEPFAWKPRVYYRYAEAEDSHTIRSEISGGLGEGLPFLGGISYRDFGDIRGGHDMGLQPNTGYSELNGDFKLKWALGSHKSLTVAHQQVHQEDVPRTHKTVFAKSFRGTTVGKELKRDLDQDRELTYLKYETSEMGAFVDALQVTLSWHEQIEKQHRVREDKRSDSQGLDVNTLGMSLQLESLSQFGQWTYGFEYYHDDVDSFRRDFDADGLLRSVRIQGPVAGDATYDSLGVFVQDDIPLYGERLDLIFGGRFNYARADADKVEDPETGYEMSISDDWSTTVGSARILYQIDADHHWYAFSGVSQGFRAPNLSDLTRLDTARTDEIETPSPDLDPEDFIAYEIGMKAFYENFSGQLAYFYTDIDNMIVRTPTGDVVEGDNEVTKKNAGDGYIHGVELNLGYRFHPRFTLFGSLFWMEGFVETFPTAAPVKVEEPIDRLQPLTGVVGLRWEHPRERIWVEFVATLADDQDKLSTRDKADTQRIPPGGTPGYTVYCLRAGWKVTYDLILSAAVENITDKDYRIHGSGQNEAGTNVVFALDWSF